MIRVLHTLYTLGIMLMIPMLAGCIQKSMLLFSNRAPSVEDGLYKQTKNMTFKEAVYAKEYYQKEKNTDMAIKCGQRLVTVGGNEEGDAEIMRMTTLEIAQAFLERGQYKQAQKYALEYETVYPGTPETKQAAYINIKAHYLSTFDPERTQEPTEQTIELAENFMSKYPDDTTYTPEIKSMVQACYLKLLKSELGVIQTNINLYKHYLNPAYLQAALARIEYSRNKLLVHAPQLTSELQSYEDTIKQLLPKNPVTS